MRCFHRLIVLVFVLWWAVIGARPAHAQSVVNGDFNCSVIGWTYYGDFSWNALNYTGTSGSGSARMEVTQGTTIYTDTANQCLGGVESSTPYRWRSWVYIPGCQTNPGDAYLQLVWYATEDCTGDAIASEPFTTVIDETMMTEWLPSDSGTRLSPEGAQSARLFLSVTRYDPGSFKAHFDGVTFEKMSVFADGFESSDCAAWCASVP
jgi:hypothetical protein